MSAIKVGLYLIAMLPCMVLSAQSADPRITLDFTEARLSEVLDEITRQSGMHTAYNPQQVDIEEQITYSCRNMRVTEVLDEISEIVFIEYAIIEGQIVLTPMEASQLPVYMVTGYVMDSASAENLLMATVAADNGSQGTTTNEYGYYAIPLRRGKHTLYFSYLGYKQFATEIRLKDNTSLNIELPLASESLPEIEIRAIQHSIGAVSGEDLGEMTLRQEDINILPELAGESGLVKNLEHLPGIKQHSDVSAFFFVRGGERDQNIIFIDDAPIYNPSHLLGLSSMVAPDFAQQITVHKSDMPANMGDRLSSIINIRTRDGNLNQFGMSGSISPFVSRLSMEIPLIKQRSSLFVSYRRSTYEFFYKRSNPNIDLFFQDFHLKWNYRPNDRNRFYITIIGSGDNFQGQAGDVSNINWGNLAATLRWNHTYSPRLFSNTTLYTGNYANNVSIAPNYWKSELGTLSLKSDFTHYIGRAITAKFGLELQGYFTTPGQVTSDNSASLLPNITRNYGRKIVGYYQAEARIREKMTLNAGLRVIQWANTGPTTYYLYDEQYQPSEQIDAPQGVYNTYLNADPRLSLEYAFNPGQRLKLSYGIYHQYLQLISNSISPFSAMEIWLTASPNIKPQRSAQWSLDYVQRWSDNTQLMAAVYYKSSENQIDLDGHATVLINKYIEGELRFGSSKAYGVEMSLRRSFGKLDATLAYTWSRVFRTTPDLNNGIEYRAFQDRPHDLSLTAVYKFSRRFLVTGYWASYSGSPFTSPQGFYEFQGQTVPIYGERNNDRLPAYHRLDLSCQWLLNKDPNKRFQHSLKFSIFNVIGRKNIYDVKFNKLYNEDFFPETPTNVLEDQLRSSSHVELIQVFPSLTYKFSL